MDLNVKPAYVLHVKSGYEDRAASIERQFAQKHIPFEYVLEWDVEDLAGETLARFFVPDAELSPAEQSLCMKHFAALERVCETGMPQGLVFEDDVILAPHFVEEFNACAADAAVPGGDTIVCIGNGCNLYTRRERLRPGQLLYPHARVRATDSLLYSDGAARKLLTHIRDHRFDLPFDTYLNLVIPALDIGVYWLEPTIVEQGSQNGTFQTALHGKTSLFMKRLDWIWEKLRRRYIWQKRHPLPQE